MKIRAFAAAIVAAVLGLGGSLVVGSPAYAAMADCTAYTNVVCLTDTANWGGRVWRQTAAQIPNCRNFGSDFNDRASLAANRYNGSVGYYLYANENCTGASLYVESWRYKVLSEWNCDNKESSIMP